MTTPLHRTSATDLCRLLATRELQATRLATALAERTAELQPRLQAWADFNAARNQRMARRLDAGAATGVLHGLPIGVKDNIDTAGVPTHYGSPIYAGHVPAADAACVALANAAGAWVAGKAACTEFANMTPSATRHPLSPRHTPGGSSSGSAVAVAAGLVPLALGTQTAGSVIRPAAFCGIVAYKPTPRRLPRAGVKGLSDTLDEVGVMARTVADAALLAQVLCNMLPAPVRRKPPRLAMTLTSQAALLSADMTAMVQAAAVRLSEAGAGMRDAAWPWSFDGLFDAQRTVQLFETARALAPEYQYRRAQLSPGLRALLAEGLRIDPAAYTAALQAGAAATTLLETVFGDAQVLLTAGAAGAAPASLKTTGDPAFSRPWQLLGCPCVVLPGALDGNDMPLGLQLVARPGHDEMLLSAAAWVERVLDSRAISEGRALD